MILLAPQNHPSLRESYPRCNDPAKRGSVCADAGLHSQVISTCVSLKFIQITGNFVGKEEMYVRDGLHLSGKGAAVFAEGLSGAVASGLGKVRYLN